MPVSVKLLPQYSLCLDFSLVYPEKAPVLLPLIFQLFNEVPDEPQPIVTWMIKVGLVIYGLVNRLGVARSYEKRLRG